MVAEIFPMEQFQSSDEGRRECGCSIERASSITLCFGCTRSFAPDRYETLCLSIAADLGDKVLSKEYTERSD